MHAKATKTITPLLEAIMFHKYSGLPQRNWAVWKTNNIHAPSY